MFRGYYHTMPVSTVKARKKLLAATDPVVNSMMNNSVAMHVEHGRALERQQGSSNVVMSVADLLSLGVRFDEDRAKSQYYEERAASVAAHREAARRKKALYADIGQFAARMEPYGPFLQNQQDIEATASRLGDMRLTNKRNYVPLEKDKRRRLFQKKVER